MFLHIKAERLEERQAGRKAENRHKNRQINRKYTDKQSENMQVKEPKIQAKRQTNMQEANRQ
jgi:hypothetical protein